MSRALVVFSGGQDSTTCLYWAKVMFDEVHAITINYGQKHDIEVKAARKIAHMAELASHEVINVPSCLAGSSPLVNSSEVVEQYASAEVLPGGLEKTFVPCRNLLFLTLAANRAVCAGITDIVTGVCEEDYGGYPDCRRVFIDAVEQALQTGLDKAVRIHTPLMYLSKRATVDLARRLPGCWKALAFSHTCYNGVYPPCGKCHACHLRQRGFVQANEIDPMLWRADHEVYSQRGDGQGLSLAYLGRCGASNTPYPGQTPFQAELNFGAKPGRCDSSLADSQKLYPGQVKNLNSEVEMEERRVEHPACCCREVPLAGP